MTTKSQSRSKCILDILYRRDSTPASLAAELRIPVDSVRELLRGLLSDGKVYLACRKSKSYIYSLRPPQHGDIDSPRAKLFALLDSGPKTSKAILKRLQLLAPDLRSLVEEINSPTPVVFEGKMRLSSAPAPTRFFFLEEHRGQKPSTLKDLRTLPPADSVLEPDIKVVSWVDRLPGQRPFHEMVSFLSTGSYS